MNKIMENTARTLGRVALKTIGAIRVKTKTSDNKQAYNDFLQKMVFLNQKQEI